MVLCSCGRVAVVRTSWTAKNSGRRFWGCPVMGSDCPVVGWYDHQMCDRSKVVIPGLLRPMNNFQATIVELKEENRKLQNISKGKKGVVKPKYWANCSWVLFVILFVVVYVLFK